MLSEMTADPAPSATDTAMPVPACRITLPVATTLRRYGPQPRFMPNSGAFSMTLPLTVVSASTVMPTPKPGESAG